jgi:hypothetical protein
MLVVIISGILLLLNFVAEYLYKKSKKLRCFFFVYSYEFEGSKVSGNFWYRSKGYASYNGVCAEVKKRNAHIDDNIVVIIENIIEMRESDYNKWLN